MTDINNKTQKKRDELDVQIGLQLRRRREKLSFSQTDLGKILNISYQQIQKYEKGDNKIPAGRLFQFAKLLKVTPDYFFEGVVLEKNSVHEKKYLQLERKNSLNILLIEDNPVDEMLTIDAINTSKSDANIMLLHDGDQAVEYLKNIEKITLKKRPDIILLDINIPKRNGLDVLKEIKRDRRINHIPVIILTNSINPMDMKLSYQYSACGFVNKSFNVDEYNRKIALIIDYWASVAILPSMQVA
ncbi:MAG: response regulator [Rickettsiales bacterium]|nr:response regulator [Rickettsiales bacterium]